MGSAKIKLHEKSQIKTNKKLFKIIVTTHVSDIYA